MTGHTGPVWAVAAVPLPDGRVLLASAGRDETVRLWDPQTGAAVGGPLTGHIIGGVIGEPQRAFSGNQFGLVFPLFVHYGVPLWVPEVGGPIDPNKRSLRSDHVRVRRHE